MTTAATSFVDTPAAALIVCPRCDAAYRMKKPGLGERAVCARCGTVLAAPRQRAGLQMIVIAVTVVILIVSATIFPFLEIRAGGRTNAVSILDAALSFGGGPLIALALVTAAFIIFVPLLRMLLTLYVLIPLVRDRPPARHAIRAFRLSEALRPWSMAEIFAIGCAVALVKITEIAQVDFGPAFWMFGVLVVLVVAQDSFMCKWSVWNALENPKRR